MHDVAAGLHLTVDLHDDAIAQAVQHQHLLRLQRGRAPTERPPCLIDVNGDAPVPPSWPEMSTTSACALATPAATVPTPAMRHQLHVDPRASGSSSSDRE